jgi:HD superfamily phosphohydrolase
MAQSVFPNATHTRFAHSIGALGMMIRILEAARINDVKIPTEQQEDLRLAALLHDVGHYPYSHLMERIDAVVLTEDEVGRAGTPAREINATQTGYPRHEEMGRLIATNQHDLADAIGGVSRAKAVADIFTRTGSADAQFSKLIHSSFDIDRWDYLARDSHAAGVPYGNIDIHYLLNNLQVSPDKTVGFPQKALPALEHFLLARFFMHRVVYYHKTIYGLEEACRQLLRRLRDHYPDRYEMPRDGRAVEELVRSDKLHSFTDAFVDTVVREAAKHVGDKEEDEVIRTLARAIQSRKPPKLLKEVSVYEKSDTKHHAGTAFLQRCGSDLKELSTDFRIPLGQFLLCAPKVDLVKVPPEYSATQVIRLTRDDVTARAHKEEEEQIWVFREDDVEPTSLLDCEPSLVKQWAKFFSQAFRLYVVLDGLDANDKVAQLRERVKDWGESQNTSPAILRFGKSASLSRRPSEALRALDASEFVDSDRLYGALDCPSTGWVSASGMMTKAPMIRVP